MAVYPWLVIVEPFTVGISGMLSGSTDGTYYGVPVNGGGGTGATVTVVVSGGVITNTDINGNLPVTSTGSGYAPQTPFTTPFTATGSGITLTAYTGGPTDQTYRLYIGDRQQHGISQVMFQRGSADVPIYVLAGDSYYPTVGCQIYLYDQTAAGPFTIFAGTISRIEETWDGKAGYRLYHLTCVTMQSFLDCVLVPPTFSQYAKYAGTIVEDLLALRDLTGIPITTGTIQQGAFVPNYAPGDWPRVSEAIQKQADVSQFIWQIVAAPPAVNSFVPASIVLNFETLSTTPAPFTLLTKQVLWGTMKWEANRDDYRNRQILAIQPSAFAQSSEAFAWSGNFPSYFTLLRNPDQITFAWVTQGTQSQALGTFTGQPSPGDTISINYNTSPGSIYSFQNSYPYVVGQTIIDNNGFLQTVTVGNQPGENTELSQASGTPSWNDTIGGTTTSLDIVFTCGGKPIDVIYTFVTTDTLDNTQWGQVVIQATLAETIQALVDAINCNQAPSAQGVTFSFPTWENPTVNAYDSSSLQFGSGIASDQIMVRDKSCGPYTSSLAASSTHFSWSSSTTSGGAATNTVQLNVAVNGTSDTANLYYTPGQPVCALASVPAGVNSHARTIQIQYTRQGGGVIICENTDQVEERAALEHSSGRYQQLTSDQNQANAAAGLMECQQLLAAFDQVPQTFWFDTYVAGLAIGQALTIDIIDGPPDVAQLINTTTWFVEEIQAKLVPFGRQGFTQLNVSSEAGMWLESIGGPPGSGHYLYTVKVINVSQTGTWVNFWQDLIGAGSSSGLGGGGGSTGQNQIGRVTFNVNVTTIGTWVQHPVGILFNSTALRIGAMLRDTITADLVIQLYAGVSGGVPGTLIGTITIPHTTAVGVWVFQTTFSGSTALAKDQVITWSITASDGSTDPDGVATVFLDYQ